MLQLKMYEAKCVLYWILVLCCWQGTDNYAKAPSISLLNRTRVALAGDTLPFNLVISIPANFTSNVVGLFSTPRKVSVWNKTLKSDIHAREKNVEANIKMHNSFSSGEYYFIFADKRVYFTVLVRDRGYQEPGDELEVVILILMIFTGILLIFNIAGSVYIFKSYKELTVSRDDRNKVTGQRPEESDDVMMDEDAASASLYTALQNRPGSIYEILHQETTTQKENNQEKTSGIEDWKYSEDENKFDSVYENL